MDSTVTPANKIQQKTLSNADDALEVYKKLVNFCECNQLKDYFTETPLLCYVNREEFLKLLRNQKSASTLNTPEVSL